MLLETKAIHPKTLLLGVYAPGNEIQHMEDYFEEFLSLVKTSGLQYDQTLFIKIRNTDPSHYLMKGKRQEIADFCKEHEIEEVICSEILSPLQERNLSNLFDCLVFDRTQLILEIFNKAAHTAEAKTQVEIAQLEYYKTRMSGRGLELGQQEGRIGTRGPGETQKEQLKRLYETKISQAKKKLETLEKTRDVQRKKRLASNMPLVAIIGYTNAGKSSLLNILTKENVLAEDKLFATLDTTTRSLFLDHTKKILISDTVGFISQLPHTLIQSFKSTLDELKYADLLLHVIDISNAMWENQIMVVNTLLNELEIEKPIVYIFNKIDKAKDIPLETLEIETSNYRPSLFTSTYTKEGIEELLSFLKSHFFETTKDA